jgi:hypothetical protein
MAQKKHTGWERKQKRRVEIRMRRLEAMKKVAR